MTASKSRSSAASRASSAPPPPSKRLKRVHPWHSEYARSFGTRVVERDPDSGTVLAVECLFCVAFGREERVAVAAATPTNSSPAPKTAAAAPPSATTSLSPRERKTRACSHKIATWKNSFRTDNMRSHHNEQHPRKWQEYQVLLALAAKEQLAGEASSSDDTTQSYTAQLDAFFGNTDASVTEPSSLEATPPAAATEASASKQRSRDTVATRQRSAPPSRRQHKLPTPRRLTSATAAPTRNTPVPPALLSARDSNGVTLCSADTLESVAEPPSPAPTDELSAPIDKLSALTADIAAPTVKLSAPTDELPTPTAKLSPPLLSLPLSPTHVAITIPAIVDELLPRLFGADGVQSSAPSRCVQLLTTATSESPVAYHVELPRVREFAFVQQLLVLDAPVSLAQTAQIVTAAHATLCLNDRDDNAAQLLTRADVCAYARLVVTTSLQRVALTMRAAWAFALVLESVGNSTGIAMRVRVPLADGADVVELHVVTLALGDAAATAANVDNAASSTSDAAAALIAQTLAVLDPHWRQKLLGIADGGSVRDCAATVAPVLRALQQQVETAPLYRAWRGAELFEAAVYDAVNAVLGQAVPESASSTAFLDTLDAALTYLRGQPQWCASHSASSNVLALERPASPWSLRQTLEWFAVRRDAISELQQTAAAPANAAARLAPQWWLVCLAVIDFLSDCERLHTALQGGGDAAPASVSVSLSTDTSAALTLPPPPSRGTLRQFVDEQAAKLGVALAHSDSSEQASANTSDDDQQQQPLEPKQPAPADWPSDRVVAFFRSLNLSTRRLYTNLSAADQAAAVAHVRAFVVHALRAVAALDRQPPTDDSDSSNSSNDVPPPTRPLEFAAIARAAVVDLVELHSVRLERALDVAAIDAIAKEMNELRTLVHGATATSAALRSELLHVHSASTFRAAWAPLERHAFTHTRAFAAGLATAVPRSDFERTLVADDRFAATAVTRNRCSVDSSSTAAQLEAEAHAHARQLERIEMQ